MESNQKALKGQAQGKGWNLCLCLDRVPGTIPGSQCFEKWHFSKDSACPTY